MSLRTPCDAVNNGGHRCTRPARFQVRGGPDLVNSCGTHLSGYVAEFVERWGAVTTRPTAELVEQQRRERFRRMAKAWLDLGDHYPAIVGSAPQTAERYAEVVETVAKVMARAVRDEEDPDLAADAWLAEREGVSS